MEYNFCRQSQDDCRLFWVEIADIGGGPSILYVLNGGKRPPSPMVGHFAYDLLSMTFQVYYPHNWRNITIEDIECLVWHPSANHSFVDITRGGLPFWNPVNRGDERRCVCKFETIQGLLSHFTRTFAVNKIKITLSPAFALASGDKNKSGAIYVDDGHTVGRPIIWQLTYA